MPNDNIMGIPTKACVNGITKTDALEIKKIPELDERVTALEQGDGNESWSITNNPNDVIELKEISGIPYPLPVMKNDTVIVGYVDGNSTRKYYTKGEIFTGDKFDYNKFNMVRINDSPTNLVMNYDSINIYVGVTMDENQQLIFIGYYYYWYGNINFNPSVQSSSVYSDNEDLEFLTSTPVLSPDPVNGILIYVKSTDVHPIEPDTPNAPDTPEIIN